MKPAGVLLCGVVVGAIGAFAQGVVFDGAPADMAGDSVGTRDVRDIAGASTRSDVALSDPAASPDTAESPLIGAQLDRYRAIAEMDSEAEIVARIELWAASDSGRERDLTLEALLVRLAAINPDRAIATVLRQQLPSRFAVVVYRAWINVAANDSLRSLHELTDPILTHQIVMSLLETFGTESDLGERILGSLSPAEIATVSADLLVRMAEDDPEQALQRALRLHDNGARTRIAQRIAAVRARENPVEAMQAAADIGDARIRSLYSSAVVAEWSRRDSEAALAYLVGEAQRYGTTVDPAALSIIAASDPERMLAAAESLSSAVRQIWRTQALTVLVERDPVAALSLMDALPSTADREQLRQLVADIYPRQHPAEAFAWAINTGSTPLIQRTLTAIALDRPVEAVELAMTQPDAIYLLDSIFDAYGGPPLKAPTSVNPQAMPEVADRLYSAGAHYAESLHRFLESWSGVDPDGAWNWAWERGQDADVEALASLARGLAISDGHPSNQLLDVLPQDLRSRWIGEAAQVFAVTEPDVVLQWLDGFRHEAEYDAWIVSAVQQMTNLPGLAADQAAAPGPVLQWAATQPDAALRDRVLAVVLAQGIVSHGIVEQRLLNAFSGDTARQQALTDSVAALAVLHRRDPGQARNLVETHFASPALRDAVDQRLGPEAN